MRIRKDPAKLKTTIFSQSQRWVKIPKQPGAMDKSDWIPGRRERKVWLWWGPENAPIDALSSLAAFQTHSVILEQHAESPGNLQELEGRGQQASALCLISVQCGLSNLWVQAYGSHEHSRLGSGGALITPAWCPGSPGGSRKLQGVRGTNKTPHLYTHNLKIQWEDSLSTSPLRDSPGGRMCGNLLSLYWEGSQPAPSMHGNTGWEVCGGSFSERHSLLWSVTWSPFPLMILQESHKIYRYINRPYKVKRWWLPVFLFRSGG